MSLPVLIAGSAAQDKLVQGLSGGGALTMSDPTLLSAATGGRSPRWPGRHTTVPPSHQEWCNSWRRRFLPCASEVYLDRLMNNGENLDFRIVGVGTMPGDARMRDAMKAQDCLYTLVVKHPDGSRDATVIGSMIDYLFAPDDPRPFRTGSPIRPPESFR